MYMLFAVCLCTLRTCGITDSIASVVLISLSVCENGIFHFILPRIEFLLLQLQLEVNEGGGNVYIRKSRMAVINWKGEIMSR